MKDESDRRSGYRITLLEKKPSNEIPLTKKQEQQKEMIKKLRKAKKRKLLKGRALTVQRTCKLDAWGYLTCRK